jgi:predicted class III extradiol MEMO1 family dioxygenase
VDHELAPPRVRLLLQPLQRLERTVVLPSSQQTHHDDADDDADEDKKMMMTTVTIKMMVMVVMMIIITMTRNHTCGSLRSSVQWRIISPGPLKQAKLSTCPLVSSSPTTPRSSQIT